MSKGKSSIVDLIQNKKLLKAIALIGIAMTAYSLWRDVTSKIDFASFMFEEALQRQSWTVSTMKQAKDWRGMLVACDNQTIVLAGLKAHMNSLGRVCFWSFESYMAIHDTYQHGNDVDRTYAETKIREAYAKNVTLAINVTQVKPPEVYIPRKGDILVKQWIMDKEYAGIVERLKLGKVTLLDGPYYVLTGHVEVRGESKSGASWKLRFPTLGVELYLSKGLMVIGL